MFLDLFLLPVLAMLLVMGYCWHCADKTTAFRGFFAAVAGFTAFGVIFVLALIYTICKAVLP